MKKGYTLVEILAVIIILGIVLGITVPILLGVYDKTKEDAYNKSVDNIILAAKYYVTENHLLYKDLDEFVITMQKLYDEKYLSYPQTNPIDETTMEGGIIVKRENAVLKYEYSDFLSGTPEECFIFNKLTQTIVGYEFKNLPCINEVIIPTHIDGIMVKIIGNHAFSSMGLKSILFPNTITKIEASAFYYNELTSLKIPKGITIIGSGAFRENQLSEIILSDSVRIIENTAFQQNQLTSIVIPSSVISIGHQAFSSNQLNKIDIRGENVVLADNLLTNNDNFRLAYYANGIGVYSGTQAGTWIKQ